MNLKATLIIVLTSAIVACGGAPDSAEIVTSATQPDRKSAAPKTAQFDAGSINIAVSGKTVEVNSKNEPNSKQCQVNFTVENRGESEIKSLIVDFDVLNRTTAEVIEAESQMVIAVKIGVGETVSPWGSHTIDNFRCADLTLRFPEQMSYKCITTTKARCARFKFNGSEDVMVEHAVSTLSED